MKNAEPADKNKTCNLNKNEIGIQNMQTSKILFY